MKILTIKETSKPRTKRWTTAEIAENVRLMSRTEAELQAELADAQAELADAQAAESSARETAKAVPVEDDNTYYKVWDNVWKTSNQTWNAKRRMRAAQAALEAKRMDDKTMNLDQSMRDIYVGMGDNDKQMDALRAAQTTARKIREIARDAEITHVTIPLLYEVGGETLESAKTALAHIDNIEALAKAAENLLEAIDRAVKRPHTKDDLIALIGKFKKDQLTERLRETCAHGNTLPMNCYIRDIWPDEYHTGYAFSYPEDRIPDEIQRINLYAPENTNWTNRFHEYLPPIWAEIEWNTPYAKININFPGRWKMPDIREI